MDEDGACTVLPHNPCCYAEHDDLSCLTHGLSCLDQQDPCFAHVLACLDQSSSPRDPCLDPDDPFPDQHDEPCSDPQQLMHRSIPCLDGCEQFYLHLKPHADELQDVVRNSSIIMNELFDSKDYFNMSLGDGEEEEEEEERSSSSSSSSSSDAVGNHVLCPPSAEKCDSSDVRLRSWVEAELGEDVREEEALLLAEVERAERLGLEWGPVEEMISDSDQSSPRRKRKGRKKKMKADWTTELHQRFVHVVEQLGVEKAIPSKILELMDVNSLTRHNVASHLQKYRSHKKQMPTWSDEIGATLVANDLRTSWPSVLSGGAKALRPAKRGGDGKTAERQHQPMLPLPELHVWGHPTTAMERFWPPCWPSPSLGCAWGNPFLYTPPHPIMRIPLAPMLNQLVVPVVPPPKHQPPAKEMVAASINEVLRNPLVPLPLGLKPPPLESVISELQRRGVSTVS